jgi:outer membrane protein assembly factor BamE (lipoprotein component of BamABCDE complex)
MSGFRLSLLVAGVAGLAAACAPIVSHRGYFPDPRKTDAIKAGVDTKETIQDRLGTPTQMATFDPNTWYYISATESLVAWHAPRIVKQSVIAIQFDADGKVKDVKRMDDVRPRQFAMVQRITATRGRTLSFWEQMFGNVGRLPGTGEGNPTGDRGGPPAPGRR